MVSTAHWNRGRHTATLLLWVAPLLTSAGPVRAQDSLVGSNLTEDFVARESPIELTFDRSALGENDRISVFAGQTDITDLFDHTADGLRYAPVGLPLAPGRTDLVVYRVSADKRWSEVGRFPLNVLSRFGFESGTTDPSVSASYARPLSRGSNQDDPTPLPDGTLDLQLSIRTEHVRQGLTAKTSASFVGAVERSRALRFGQLQDQAPRLDLSSYSAQVGSGALEFALGNVSFGNQRHLINGFSSRGAAASLRPHAKVDVQLGLANGSSVVGYGNFFGLSVPDHRVMSGSLGFDAFSEPGRLKLEISGMSGSVLPVSGFNQGAITDAERSRGAAVRLQANALDRRLRLDVGLARSAFENPPDPELDQGFDVVPVIEEFETARYAEASLDAIRSLALGQNRSVRLSLGYRHERVAPQYRSLGAFAQADRLQDQVSAQANLAGIGVQVGHARTRDNLDDVPSILTTDTRRTDTNVSLPVAAFLGVQTPLLPSLQVQWNRTQQAGRGIPVNGGFSESHVPDQVSTVRAASANWNAGPLGFGLRWNRSDQDNRQVGREAADFRSDVRAVDARFAWRRLQVNADVGLEAATSFERDERRETTRYGLGASVQISARTSLTLRLARTSDVVGALPGFRKNRSVDGQLSSVIPGLTGFDGQWFLRFSHNRFEVDDPAFGLSDDRRLWTLDSGMNLTFF